MPFKSLTWAVVLLVAGAVIATVVPFAWFLHARPIATDSGEAWSHFASYFSGMIGPFLSILNLGVIIFIGTRVSVFQERTVSTKKLTVDLLREWNSDLVHQSRILTSKHIKELEDLGRRMPTLSELEDSVHTERSKSAFRIYHFFEVCSVLAQERQVDVELLKRIMGSYIYWWRDHFFQPIRDRETSPSMKSAIERMYQELFDDVKPNPTFQRTASPPLN